MGRIFADVELEDFSISLSISLQVEVSDVLAEPATPRSIDQVWRYSVAGFETTRIWTYRCLSLLLAVPFALLCGVFLAILACLHVWYAGAVKKPPCVTRHCHMLTHPCRIWLAAQWFPMCLA